VARPHLTLPEVGEGLFDDVVVLVGLGVEGHGPAAGGAPASAVGDLAGPLGDDGGDAAGPIGSAVGARGVRLVAETAVGVVRRRPRPVRGTGAESAAGDNLLEPMWWDGYASMEV